MPKTRVPYAPEFRRQMVELVRAGRDPADLAREFEPSAQTIRSAAVAVDGSRRPTGGGGREVRPTAAEAALTAAERDELARPPREGRQLRVERDILSRAAAWFARETGTMPPGSSGSFTTPSCIDRPCPFAGPCRSRFLETAVNGRAECLVSGDADLLALDPFEGVRIPTPREFVEAVPAPGPG